MELHPACFNWFNFLLDLVDLPESRVVLKAIARVIAERHLREHRLILAVRPVDRKTAAEVRLDQNLPVVEGGPFVRLTVPGLRNLLQSLIRVICERAHATELDAKPRWKPGPGKPLPASYLMPGDSLVQTSEL